MVFNFAYILGKVFELVRLSVIWYVSDKCNLVTKDRFYFVDGVKQGVNIFVNEF